MRRIIDAFFLWTAKALASWVALGERRLAESRVEKLYLRYSEGEPISADEIEATCKPLAMSADQWRTQAMRRHAEHEQRKFSGTSR